MEKQQLKDLNSRIRLLRNITILFHITALVVTATIFFIPNILSQTLKIGLVSVCGASFIGIIVVLIVARKDSTVTVFFIIASATISGFFIGIFIGKVDVLFIH